MKKITKAAIAGTVGAALLVGGAGSLAFWTDTESGPAVAVQSGNLDLGVVGNGSWTIQQSASDMPTGKAQTSSSAVTVSGSPASLSESIVPGDVLTTTVSVPVALVGKNIKAALKVTPTVTATGGPTTQAGKLAAVLNSATNPIKVVSINGTTPAADNSVTLTPANIAAGTVSVVIAVTFPWGTATTAVDGAALGSVQFNAAYTLTQVPVTP